MNDDENKMKNIDKLVTSKLGVKEKTGYLFIV